MLTPDLCSRTYTAEVLRTRGSPQSLLDTIARLTAQPSPHEEVREGGTDAALLLHCFFASPTPYHRVTREVQTPSRGTITIPRTTTVGRKTCYLYDVLVACHRRDVVVAVPFHRLAEELFVTIDRAATGALYEKLDIRTLVIRLGQSGVAQLSSGTSARTLEIGVTRCQLAYSDPEGRKRDLQQVSMSGAHIGATDVYSYLTGPVLKPHTYELTVTPILLGFALFEDGVRKTTATTDQHGNFKLWVGPGITRLERLFSLLDGVESLKGIVSTTSNLPILLSGAITGAAEA